MWERASVAGHYREVFRFVRRRAGSVEEAEDVTQDTFANAAAALADAAREAPPSLAWLYTVARRRMVDEARRRSRARTMPLELVDEPPAQERYGEAVASTLRAGLAGMPEGQRVVVVGRLLQGRSFAEIARELSLTEDACRMRFMRGLQHLRDAFEKEGLT
jgi:RNA polymerase sigma-70 factor (ECF subfamily)